MGTASVILGALGLIAICVGLPLMLPALFFGGGGASLAAVIIGLMGRDGSSAAKAGIVLGALGVVGIAGIFFLFRGSQVEVAQPQAETKAVEVKAIEAMPPS